MKAINNAANKHISLYKIGFKMEEINFTLIRFDQLFV